jgi:hypothetical protein
VPVISVRVVTHVHDQDSKSQPAPQAARGARRTSWLTGPAVD